MVINESALLRAMREDYKGQGYTVARRADDEDDPGSESSLLLSANDWMVEIGWKNVSAKIFGLVWCSECGRESVAEWISAKSCHGYGLSSGIGIEDDFNNATGEYQDGAEMHCPACGENVTLKSATAMNHGHTDQTFITVPTVCGSYPVFTVFCAERRIYKRSVHYSAVPFEAYVIDGKKAVKLVAYRRGFGGGWYSLGGWQQLSRAVDTMCAPIMYWRTPDLSGTVLENAKLWDYKAQAYEDHSKPWISKRNASQRHTFVHSQRGAGFCFSLDGNHFESVGHAEEKAKRDCVNGGLTNGTTWWTEMPAQQNLTNIIRITAPRT